MPRKKINNPQGSGSAPVLPIEQKPVANVCLKCKGLGYVFENGIVHTCWDCLESGRLG